MQRGSGELEKEWDSTKRLRLRRDIYTTMTQHERKYLNYTTEQGHQIGQIKGEKVMLKRVLIPALTMGLVMGFADDSATKAKKISLAGGKKVYQTFCIACHGEKGKGDGAAGMAMTPKPRNFTDTAFINKEPKMRMYSVITDGGKKNGLSPMMAAWGKTIKPDQINDVLAYVLTFGEDSTKAIAHVMNKEKEKAEAKK